MKLKMKALLPIFVALIGLKAVKALILSKLAITIVLGFVIAQLVKKTGLGMPMSMMPMMPAAPEPPMPSYGPPTTPDPSYGPPGYEPSAAGSSYSRVWEPSVASSSHNLAYSSYYPSGSSVYEKSASPSSSSVSSSSSSASQPMTAKAY